LTGRVRRFSPEHLHLGYLLGLVAIRNEEFEIEPQKSRRYFRTTVGGFSASNPSPDLAEEEARRKSRAV
jgi:hypothetical protein